MNILVLCTGNSCRSQIAHGYLNHFAQFAPFEIRIYSAGIETHGVNPKAIATMQEDGIDITHHTSNNVNEYHDIQFSYVITVCDHANEQCPVYLGKATKIHHNFRDPAKAIGTDEEVLAIFRSVRGEIKVFCQNFIQQLTDNQ